MRQNATQILKFKPRLFLDSNN